MYSALYEERELGWDDSAYDDSIKGISTVDLDGHSIKIGKHPDGTTHFYGSGNWWETAEQALAEIVKSQAERNRQIEYERKAKDHTLQCEVAIQSLGLNLETCVYNSDSVKVRSPKKGSLAFPTRGFTPNEVAQQVLLWETTETKAEKAAALRKAGKPVPKHLR